MKFTAGYWNMRPGVTPYYPAEARDIEISDNALIVYAPTRKINHRGDTLNIPTLRLRFSSPMENVIRVQVSHFTGGKPRKPEFVLDTEDALDLEWLRRETGLEYRPVEDRFGDFKLYRLRGRVGATPGSEGDDVARAMAVSPA